MDYSSTFWEILQKKNSVCSWDKTLNLGPDIKPSNKEEKIFEYNPYRTTRKQLCKARRM